ncbi:MAG: aminotransferase class V-fold PLP-dependent enzyme [Candidatus Dormibacteraceae bacterium]
MSLREKFALDPELAFLNHASFGATPNAVVSERARLQRHINANPLPALTTEFATGLDAARAALADHVGAPTNSLIWTPNTTFGMNLVARSLAADLRAGDEVILANSEYGSMIGLWQWICGQRCARLVMPSFPLPAPITATARADVVLSAITERTRILISSHVTCDTALRMPVTALCAVAREQGVTTIIDGAHGPGQLALNLAALGCDYYAADLHKWLCAPCPTGFLYASPTAQQRLDPLIVSWGGIDREVPLSTRQEFAGTTDPSNWLTVPFAIRFYKEQLCSAVQTSRQLLTILCPAMADLGLIPVVNGLEDELLMKTWLPTPEMPIKGLGSRLRNDHQVELQVVEKSSAGPLLRVSTAWYTEAWELEWLVGSLRAELARKSSR